MFKRLYEIEHSEYLEAQQTYIAISTHLIMDYKTTSFDTFKNVEKMKSSILIKDAYEKLNKKFVKFGRNIYISECDDSSYNDYLKALTDFKNIQNEKSRITRKLKELGQIYGLQDNVI